jgi:hypothetical protein
MKQLLYLYYFYLFNTQGDRITSPHSMLWICRNSAETPLVISSGLFMMGRVKVSNVFDRF